MKKYLGIISSLLVMLPSYALAETIEIKKSSQTLQGFSMNLLYNTVLPLLGVLALGSLIWGGVTIMMSGGEDTKISQGRTIITWSIVGILLIIFSYGIIYWLTNALTTTFK